MTYIGGWTLTRAALYAVTPSFFSVSKKLTNSVTSLVTPSWTTFKPLQPQIKLYSSICTVEGNYLAIAILMLFSRYRSY